MKTNIQFIKFIGSLFFTVAFLALSSGCKSPASDDSAMEMYKRNSSAGAAAEPASEPLTLREGDVVNITFPGAPDLNTVQQIRRDGKITIQLIGEINAAGFKPAELEKEILRLCGPQLASPEVRVIVNASTFPVFVSGAVLRPGKIMSDRPINALQAVMEAGGFDYTRADLTSVRVIRQEGQSVQTYRVNLKLPLQGKSSAPFNLKPADIIFVPERFSWF